MSDAVIVERLDKHIVSVTINRPEAMNAVNPDVTRGIDAAVTETEADPDVWVVIIKGAGCKAFCTGADLKSLSQSGQKGLGTRIGGFASFVFRARTKPWIAAVGGFALAGGLEITLACELAIASDRATFGLPEVRRGVIAGAGGLYRLTRAIPRHVAMDYILTGRQFSAQEAFQYGLVSRLVRHEDLDSEALALARSVCEGAPVAIRESIGIARRAFDASDEALKLESREASQRNSTTDDYKEGPRAFVEKRAPRWIGR